MCPGIEGEIRWSASKLIKLVSRVYRGTARNYTWEILSVNFIEQSDKPGWDEQWDKKGHVHNSNMNKESKDKVKGTLIVPVGLAIILIPFSMLIGWNLITLILFWLVLTPGLTIYLPTLASGNKNHLLESLSGLTIFYAIIVFMIYDHYQTDYFQLMIWSCAINFVSVPVITWLRRGRKHNEGRDLIKRIVE
jgi:hypothetical protein